MNKDTTFSIRIASGDLDTIKKKAKQAHLSQSDYVTRFNSIILESVFYKIALFAVFAVSGLMLML